jgi:hypothetical protein
MTDDGDGSALTLLWVVSLIALAGFAVLCLAAVDPTHGASMAFGPGGGGYRRAARYGLADAETAQAAEVGAV